ARDGSKSNGDVVGELPREGRAAESLRAAVRSTVWAVGRRGHPPLRAPRARGRSIRLLSRSGGVGTDPGGARLGGLSDPAGVPRRQHAYAEDGRAGRVVADRSPAMDGRQGALLRHGESPDECRHVAGSRHEGPMAVAPGVECRPFHGRPGLVLCRVSLATTRPRMSARRRGKGAEWTWS